MRAAMRRICPSMMRASWLVPASLMIPVLTLTLALSLGVSGCDYGGSSASEMQSVVSLKDPPPPQPLPDDPGAMLEAIVAATETVTRYTCSLQVDMELTLDTEEMTEEDLMFMGMLQGPLTLSGDMAIDEDSGAAQMDISFGMAGMTYSMGLRALDEEVYASILGQWYDLSPAIEELGSEGFAEDLDLEAIEAKVSELGVDPLAWLGEVEIVAEESLDGFDVYHLSCTPDLVLMLDDVFLLLGDQALIDLIDPTGELSTFLAEDMPTQEDFEEVRTMLPEMLTEFTVDLWAGKGDSILRKLAVSINLVPPAGEPTEGLEALDLRIVATLGDIGEPVEVEIPENVLPFTQIESMFDDIFGSDFPLLLDEELSEPISS